MLNTSLYMMFLVTSFFAVATPGPGVLMSLTGVIRYGFKTGFWTILGVASGTVVMAIISSTGLGIVIATSPDLYSLIKTLGACYMGYLGIRLYRAKPFSFQLANKEKSQSMSLTQKGFLWVQGVMLQMTNPMLIMFFISLFPQFIDAELPFLPQMIALSLTHFTLVTLVHCGYGLIATSFRGLLNSDTTARWVNRVSGTFFLALAVKVFWDMFLG